MGGAGDGLSVPEHGYAHDVEVALGRVVVEQTDRDERARRVAQHRRQQLRTGLTGTEDERSRGRFAGWSTALLEDEAPRVAHTRHDQQRDRTAGEHDADWHQALGGDGVDHPEEHGDDRRRAGQVGYLVEGSVPPAAAVQAEGKADGELQQTCRRDRDE